ncbi:MAG: hypothetical protein FWE30_01345 [Bacteroidales bacterium]|nr:hypothetical protein [Bacteroidales bacterium]
MRIAPYLCLPVALLLLGSCAKDLSCYRDMIIGSWVEQSFDGQIPATNLRGVYTFDRNETVQILRSPYQDNGDGAIDPVTLAYDVYCKSLSIYGNAARVEYEILTFTDSTLRLRLEHQIIAYKKVSAENANVKHIQNLWEMTHGSDPSVSPFRILFEADGTYRFFERDNEDWEEKTDEAGTYMVFDTFLITSGLSCWDIGFSGEEEYSSMNWQALVDEDGQTVPKTFVFTLPEKES